MKRDFSEIPLYQNKKGRTTWMNKKKNKNSSLIQQTKRDIIKYKSLYLLIIPVVIWYILFEYKPMYGVLIAFQDYRPRRGISGSEWVGLKHFKNFVSSFFFGRTVKNTLTISLTNIIFGFPAPIIFALLLNEIKNLKFKKAVQTISYMPHFISVIVMTSMIRVFVAENGFVTKIMHALFDVPEQSLLTLPQYFVPIFVVSGVWQGLGWGAIIYIAALSNVDQELYDAASIDGANRWKQTLHVTIPSIMPTIIIMLLLRLGRIMSVGYEKIILLYNEGIYETSDVISTYVYRRGLLDNQYSFGAAVSLFNTVINFALIMIFNKISKKLSDVSLW